MKGIIISGLNLIWGAGIIGHQRQDSLPHEEK
jgi:hypothetical protein